MNSKDQAGGSFSKVALIFIMSAIVGTVAGIALLTLASVFGAKEILSEKVIEGCPVISVVIASLISGYIAASELGKALLTGLIQAIVNFIILYVLGCIVFMRITPDGNYLYVFLACIVGALIGALITAIGKKKYRKRTI